MLFMRYGERLEQALLPGMRDAAAHLPPLAIIDCYRRRHARQQDIFPAFVAIYSGTCDFVYGDVQMTALASVRAAVLRLRLRARPMARRMRSGRQQSAACLTAWC